MECQGAVELDPKIRPGSLELESVFGHHEVELVASWLCLIDLVYRC